MTDRGVGRHSTRRLLQSSSIVGVGTALARLTGLARVAAVSYALGVSTLAGVYEYSNQAPNVVFELVLGGVLTATLVPQFVRHFQQGDDDATSAVFTVAMLAILAITVVGILLAPFIIDLYTLRVSGPDKAQQQELAVSFLRLFMPQMLFYGLTTLATAVLQSRRRFVAAAFAPVLNNVVLITIFLALPQVVSRPISVDDIRDDSGLLLLLGFGTTAGIAVMGLALLPALRSAGVHLRFLPRFRDAAVRTVVRLSGWTVGYVIANQIALILVLQLANERDGGAFAYLSAYLFLQLPHGLFAVSIMTAAAPELAEAGGQSEQAIRHRFSRALRLTLTVLIPAAAVLVALARPIVVAALQRGAFSPADSKLVADILVGFAAGLPFFSTYLFSLRVFYSLHDTKRPFILNCVENAINIGLAYVLFDAYGLRGLAYAFSAAYAISAVMSLVVLGRRIGGLSGRGIETSALRVLVVSAAAGGLAWMAGHVIGWGDLWTALASVLVGGLGAAAVTIGGLWLLKVEEFGELAGLVQSVGGRLMAPIRRLAAAIRRRDGGLPEDPPETTPGDSDPSDARR